MGTSFCKMSKRELSRGVTWLLGSVQSETHGLRSILWAVDCQNELNKNYIQANEARQIKKRLQTTSTLRENATDMTAFTAVWTGRSITVILKRVVFFSGIWFGPRRLKSRGLQSISDFWIENVCYKQGFCRSSSTLPRIQSL